MQHNFTHIYCDNCKKITECRADDKLYEDTSGNYVGGDLCCAACFIVIATVYIRNDVYPELSGGACAVQGGTQ